MVLDNPASRRRAWWPFACAVLSLLGFVGLEFYYAVQSSSLGFLLYTSADQGDLKNVRMLLTKTHMDPNCRILLGNLRVTTPLRTAREHGYRDIERALVGGARE